MKRSQTAIVIGATGLVGQQLLQQLLQDSNYQAVHVFVRRPVDTGHPKLHTHIIDFDQPEQWREEVSGDVLFSTLGTTIGTAGSQEAQYKVDYTYQFQMAEIAANRGTHTYVLISSAGANAQSRVFYSRMKGELDRDVQKLPFSAVRIIKPSVLVGTREAIRLGETMSISLLNAFSWIPWVRKYRPIDAAVVARAMIRSAALPEQGVLEFEWEEVFEIAGN